MTRQGTYTMNFYNETGTNLNVNTNIVTFEVTNVIFYILAVIYIFIGALAVFGNAILLYVARVNRNNSRLNYLDSVIQSLAFNDLLLGSFGVPYTTLWGFSALNYYHTGKSSKMYTLLLLIGHLTNMFKLI